MDDVVVYLHARESEVAMAETVNTLVMVLSTFA